MHRRGVAIAFVLACGASAYAEDSYGTDRVRLRLQDAEGRRHARTIVGRLVARDETSLTVLVGGELRLVVPRAEVQRFERSLGRRSRGESALRCAAIGFGIGAALGAGAGALVDDDGFISRGDSVRAASAWLGGLAAAAGAVGGALSPGERWQRGTADGPTFSLRPSRTGAGLEMAVRF